MSWRRVGDELKVQWVRQDGAAPRVVKIGLGIRHHHDVVWINRAVVSTHDTGWRNDGPFDVAVDGHSNDGPFA